MRTLYLIRGLPGSGKSFTANLIAPNSNYSADDFFMVGEEYHFNPANLREAHVDCQSRVNAAMERGDNVIAVHNTFVRYWEAEPYFNMAKKHAYTIQVIVCMGNFGSVHGVPPETVDRMRQNWEWFGPPK